MIVYRKSEICFLPFLHVLQISKIPEANKCRTMFIRKKK